MTIWKTLTFTVVKFDEKLVFFIDEPLMQCSAFTILEKNRLFAEAATKEFLLKSDWNYVPQEGFHQTTTVNDSDEFELEFSGSSEPELWMFRAKPSQAELGHFNLRAETELNFFQELQSNFQISTSVMIITNSNQLHDYLFEFI